MFVCRPLLLKHADSKNVMCVLFFRRKGSRTGKDVCCKQFSKGKDTESFTPQILCCYQNNNNIIIITKQLLKRYYIVKITTPSTVSKFKANPL